MAKTIREALTIITEVKRMRRLSKQYWMDRNQVSEEKARSLLKAKIDQENKVDKLIEHFDRQDGQTKRM